MQNSPTIAGFLQCNGGKLEEAEDFNFIVCSNRNRSALEISVFVCFDVLCPSQQLWSCRDSQFS